MKLVTVIIPSYNHEPYIVSAIESVLNQDYEHVELIVIDDGSSDGSALRVAELYELRGGFKFYQQENVGLVKTLSKGLAIAEGEYFCQLASDDKLPQNSISVRVKFLEENSGVVAVCSDAYRIDGDVITQQRMTSDRIKSMHTAKDQVAEIIKGKHPMFATGLIRRNALVECGGFDGDIFRYYEDLDTPIRLAMLGRIAYIDKPLFFRREHGTNVSSDRAKARLEIIACYQKLEVMVGFYSYKKLLSYRLMRSYLSLGRGILAGNVNTDKALQLFRSNAGHYKWKHPVLLWCWMKINIMSGISDVN